MSCHRRIDSITADAEVETAQNELHAALDAPWDDEGATERIVIAMNRLRTAQARQTLARTGLGRPVDLVGRSDRDG